jgi:hypothetical protein
MANITLSEFEIKRIEKLVGQFIEKRRPEPHIRNKLDIAFRISGQSFEIYEIRPQWDNPTIKMEGPVAKATYVKSKKIWKLYWMRADLKWHSYEPLANTKSLQRILDEIHQDSYGCFWG